MGWLQDLLANYSEGVVSQSLGPDFRMKQRAAASELENDAARRGLLGVQTEAGRAGIDTEKLKQEQARLQLAEEQKTQEELARLAGSGALPSASKEASDIASTVEGRRASTRAATANAAQTEAETGTPEEYKAQRQAALKKILADAASSQAHAGLLGAQRGLLGQAGDSEERQKIVQTYAKLSASQGKEIKPPAAYEKRFPGISADVAAAWQGMGQNATASPKVREQLAASNKLGTAVGSLSEHLSAIDQSKNLVGRLAAANDFSEMASGVGGIVARAIENGRVSDQDRQVYTAMLVPLKQLSGLGTSVLLQSPAYREYAQKRLKLVEGLFTKLSDAGKDILTGGTGESPSAPPAAPAGGTETTWTRGPDGRPMKVQR